MNILNQNKDYSHSHYPEVVVSALILNLKEANLSEDWLWFLAGTSSPPSYLIQFKFCNGIQAREQKLKQKKNSIP